jgi:carbohydrate-binding DOMON domain-containing protein
MKSGVTSEMRQTQTQTHTHTHTHTHKHTQGKHSFKSTNISSDILSFIALLYPKELDYTDIVL